MKVLVIHTQYYLHGGEDVVFENEVNLLSTVAQVETFTLKNPKGIKGALRFILSIWNIFEGRKLRKTIQRFRPDCIHIHNLHFGIGPIAIRVAKASHIPVVMTLHNYRLICPSGTLAHEGQLFTDSIQSNFPWSAVRKKVYRNSFLQTLWLAYINHVHKKSGTFAMVDRYIALTDFAKNLYAKSHLRINPEKIIVKPNFIGRLRQAHHVRDGSFLFVGRLSPEKGIPTLLESFEGVNHQLHIIGDGPMVDEVSRAALENDNISYLGFLDAPEITEHLTHATALIFPSTCYEGMPLTILESFRAGLPVIASKLGSMKSLVSDRKNGLHFDAGNADDLKKKLLMWSSLTTREKQIYSDNARKSYERNFMAESNIRQLLSIYEDVVDAREPNNKDGQFSLHSVISKEEIS